MQKERLFFTNLHSIAEKMGEERLYLSQGHRLLRQIHEFRRAFVGMGSSHALCWVWVCRGPVVMELSVSWGMG